MSSKVPAIVYSSRKVRASKERGQEGASRSDHDRGERKGTPPPLLLKVSVLEHKYYLVLCMFCVSDTSRAGILIEN